MHFYIILFQMMQKTKTKVKRFTDQHQTFIQGSGHYRWNVLILPVP